VGLRVDTLTCIRGYMCVFSSLSFELPSGHLLHLQGPNGSGKSSLLLLLATLLKPTTGKILWHGEPSHSSSNHFHLIHHKTAIQPHLTVSENLKLWEDILHTPASKVEEVGKRFALTSVQTVLASKLSQGQKQRLNLARLLLDKRPLWLLDEPFSNLDACGIKLLHQLLKDHMDGGGTVVLASHQPLETLPFRTLTLGRTDA